MEAHRHTHMQCCRERHCVCTVVVEMNSKAAFVIVVIYTALQGIGGMGEEGSFHYHIGGGHCSDWRERGRERLRRRILKKRKQF